MYRAIAERDHFECAMMVEDRLEDEAQDPNCFYAVLFTVAEHIVSSQLIKISKDQGSKNNTWTVQEAKLKVDHPDNAKAQFLNGFLVERNQILLVTWFRTTIFNENLELVND